ncbi:hypothetical protein BS78_07G118300 [Paspalum vaginatum]|nr:hypothetical protein BS78_07G118300 [Paspalum vaginatum]
MVSSTMGRHLALLLLLQAMPAAAMSACAGEDFPPGRSYVTCQDLPVLGAALHWTYDAPSLTLAFVAALEAPGGWVGWGINPTGVGMMGAQALVALVAGGASSSSAPNVRTYNITGYTPLGNASTPMAFPATGLAADVGSGGRIRLYATLRLEKATKQVVNHVWQVGSSVTRGAPDMHAVDTENLAAMGKLDLTMGAAASPPPAAGGPSSRSRDGNGDGSTSQSQPMLISRAADTAGFLALLGFWAMMVG